MLRATLLILAVLTFASPAANPARAGAGEDAAECFELLTQGGNLDMAIELCTRALNARTLRGEQLAPIYYNRGWAYDAKGDHERAIEDYDRALHIRPDYVRAFVARGYSNVRRGALTEAVQDYTKALEIDPEDFEARFNRGFTYEQLGNLDRALADYRKAQEIRPNDPRIRSAVKRHEELD